MKVSSSTPQRRPFIPALRAGAPATLSPLAFSIAGAILAAGVFFAYAPALNFQFILDDHRFLGDPRLQTPGHVWEYFTSYVWAQLPGGPTSFYRPLFVLWLRLNFIMSEQSPWGWHLLSIAKHGLVAFLLGLLVYKLLGNRVAALIAAALFALHPAQTESVAWVTVPDPLMSAAALGSVLLYLKYSEFLPESRSRGSKAGRKLRQKSRAGAAPRPSVGWLIASAGACLAAMLAKETAIVLPAILFVLMLARPLGEPFGPRSGATNAAFKGRLTRALREVLPFLGVTVLYLLLRLNALSGRLGALTQQLPWRTVLLSWPATLWFYVKVLLWPVRLRAFADPTEVDRFSVASVLLPGLAVCCAGMILAWGLRWAWRKARRDLPPREAVGVEQALLLGTLLLVLPILLTLNLNALNPHDFLHGRYVYLPLAGLTLLLATGWHLERNYRTPLLCVAGVLLAAFIVLTERQETAWKDDLTVFTVAHEIAPHNAPVALNLARTHVQIALDLADDGRCNEALPIFDQVVQQYPQDWYAWAGRGDCLVQLNDLPKAEESLRRAAELSHEPRIMQEWQQVRAKLAGMTSAAPE